MSKCLRSTLKPHIREWQYRSFIRKISPDFYTDIAKETDIFEAKVRKFFQVVLSSASEAQGRAAFLGEGYDSYDFKALQKWVLGRYPKLPLFQSFFEAMNHEGTILLNVMMKGVESERVVLPIHDAVAVRHETGTGQ